MAAILALSHGLPAGRGLAPELEVLSEEERADWPQRCWLCERRFVIGAVAAWAYSSEPVDSAGNKLDCGPVCPRCLEEGAEAMHGRLKDNLRRSLERDDTEVAEDEALLFSEGVPDIPAVEDLRKLERRAALRLLR